MGCHLSTDGVTTTAERWQDSATVNFGSPGCLVGPDVGGQTRKLKTETEGGEKILVKAADAVFSVQVFGRSRCNLRLSRLYLTVVFW